MMNTLKRYGIFRKDCKLLLQLLVTLLAFQWLMSILIPPLLEAAKSMRLLDIPDMDFVDWFPKMQSIFCVLYALVAAGHWWAEERSGDHHLLLFRFPISRRRLWTEKTLAGMTACVLFLVIQVLWATAVSTPSQRIADNMLEYYAFLTLVTAYAFAIGLPFSYFLKHTVGVIVLGVTMFIPAILIWQFLRYLHELYNRNVASVGSTGSTFSVYDLAYGVMKTAVASIPLLLLSAVVVLVYLAMTPTPCKTIPFSFRRFSVLLYKQYREMKYFIFGATVLLILAIQVASVRVLGAGPVVDGMIALIFIVSVVLSLLVGVLTYQQEEKGGLNSVLYHHPISLSEIFWSKILVNLGIAALLSVVMGLMTAMVVNEISSQITNALFSRMYNEFSKGTVYLFRKTLSLGLFGFWIGFIPFWSGVLMSHIIPNSIYGFLEGIVFVTAAICCYLYIQFSGSQFLLDFISESGIYFSFYLPILPWILIVMLIGFALTAWRAATDRWLLTASVGQRHVYITRLFCFVLAVVVLFSKVGFWDSLYLITGIHLGVG